MSWWWTAVLAPILHIVLTAGLGLWVIRRLGEQNRKLEFVKRRITDEQARLEALRKAWAQINLHRKGRPSGEIDLEGCIQEVQETVLRLARDSWEFHEAIAREFVMHLDTPFAERVFGAIDIVGFVKFCPDYGMTATSRLSTYAHGVQEVVAAFEEQRNALDASLKGS